MTTTPYAKVTMQIDGGSAVSGGQIIAGNNVIQLRGESTVAWETALWEIAEYPIGFALPAGWTNVNGIYQNTSFIPPTFTVLSNAVWGKYLIRLTVNQGLLDGVYQGPISPQPLVDISGAVQVVSPSGQRDVCFGETNQFDSFRQWVGELKRTLRAIEAGLGGGGSSGGQIITQADWYIDAATGDDSNPGTIGAPLASGEGLAVKWGIAPKIAQDTTIHTVGNIDLTAVNLRSVRCTHDVMLLFRSTPVAGRAGTITALTTGDKTLKRQWTITSSGMAGTWTTDINSRVVNTTIGANNGKLAWVGRDMGSKQAAISTPALTPTPSDADFDVCTLGAFTNGDTYQIQTLNKIKLGEIQPSSDTGDSTTRSPFVAFENLWITGAADGGVKIHQGDAAFYGCFIDSPAGVYAGHAGVYFHNCKFSDGSSSETVNYMLVDAGITAGYHTATKGGELDIGGENLTTGICYSFEASMLTLTKAVAFNAVSVAAYGAAAGAKLRIAGIVYGKDNDGAGIQIDKCADMILEVGADVNLSGTVNEFTLGGSATARPWDEIGGTYGPAIDCTWANLMACGSLHNRGKLSAATVSNLSQVGGIFHTTNATPLRVVRYPVALGQLREIRLVITAYSTDGSAAKLGSWEIKGGWKVTAGPTLATTYATTVTQQFATVGAIPDPTVTLNGNTDVDVNLVGILGENLTFKVAEFAC